MADMPDTLAAQHFQLQQNLPISILHEAKERNCLRNNQEALAKAQTFRQQKITG